MKKEIAVEIISFLFIVLFTYAAVTKLMDFEKFRVQVGQSPLLTAFGGPISRCIPAAELVTAVLLAVPRYKMIALYSSFSLMVLFSAYIIYILNFSIYIPCSCGGVLQNMGWTQHLVFNLFFTALALAGVLFYSEKQDTQAQAA